MKTIFFLLLLLTHRTFGFQTMTKNSLAGPQSHRLRT